VKLEINPTQLGDPDDARALVDVLDTYARDPMGGGKPLSGEVCARLIPDLRARILSGSAVVLLARRGGVPVGAAVCFTSYSTFTARPVLNLHDLAVVPEARGEGIGRALLAAVDGAALSRRCLKVTLEVREDNERARHLYDRHGFLDYAPSGGARTRTLFLEKRL
jgi:ribosomal protein S18 acetylase RimI-like enzyme